ncbi:MAG: hypothetical protein OXT67_01120 [Zetaproteobacteria bacterium]|nr:hypothetical protein [Zetaproteobacteria bacterium]
MFARYGWAQGEQTERPLQVPYMKRIGLVSIQVADKVSEQMAARWPDRVAHMYDVIEKSVDESGRFEVLHRALIASRWNSVNGRKFLRDDFECDVLMVPHLSIREQHLFMTLQLVSCEQEPIVEETRELGVMVVGKNQSFPDYDQTLLELVYTILNRLPLDVTVTSIQQDFLTLSAGSGLGLHLGEELKLERVSVVEKHPALGTWRTFKRQYLGVVKVVELSQHTAVAHILSLVEPDILRFGDGARSNGVYSRRYFKPLPPPQPVAVEVQEPQGVVQPRKMEPAAVVMTDTPSVEKEAQPLEKAVPSSSESVSAPLGAAPALSPWSNLRGLTEIHKFAHVDMRLGHWSWKFATPGVSSSSAQSLTSLLNFFEASSSRSFTQDTLVDANLWVGQGKMNEGSFVGFGLSTKILWSLPAGQQSGEGSVRWRLGPYAIAEGLGTQGNRFGGYDMLSVGGTVVSEGSFASLGWRDSRWTVSFQFQPFSLGMIGFLSSKRLIKSHSGFGMEWMLGQHKQEYSWGGGMRFRELHFFDVSGDNSSFFDTRLFAQLTYLL